MGKDQTINQGPLSRRSFLGLGAGVGASMLLAACGGGSSTPPGAGGGGGGGGGPFMRKLVEQFTSEHQNIKVSMNVLQWADFYPKVPTAVSSGNGPDIAIMHIDQLATNAARRVIIPVDEVATVLEYEEADFAPAVWQAGVYKEQRYGIPLDIHPLLQYHNQKDLQQAPTDRAGFEAAL